ncbi:T9SS type A sorting domain-containing protein [Crocinitomicaceae bacterium]|nr:T9SS type A sorting domain-containing protein [Crocinitomicaceae bacterium]
MWNSGYFTTYSTHSVCVGLYLCVLSGTNYEPPFVRENFASIDESVDNEFAVFPNPSDGMIAISSTSKAVFNVDLIDLNGRILWQRKKASTLEQFDVTGIEAGTYYLRIHGESSIQIEPIILY